MNNTTANGNIIHFSLGLKVTHLGGVLGRAQRSTVCKIELYYLIALLIMTSSVSIIPYEKV